MPYKTVKSTITFLKLPKIVDYHIKERNEIELIKLEKPISIESYLEIYKKVGEHYNWLDRIFMNTDLLYNIINSDTTQIFSFSINSEFAGYCELVLEENYVEILYFGLVQKIIGKGYGKYLLSKTIEKAWSYNPAWIQLNTCDLDHPNAIKTYKSMGFEEYKSIVETKKVVSKHP